MKVIGIRAASSEIHLRAIPVLTYPRTRLVRAAVDVLNQFRVALLSLRTTRVIANDAGKDALAANHEPQFLYNSACKLFHLFNAARLENCLIAVFIQGDRVARPDLFEDCVIAMG